MNAIKHKNCGILQSVIVMALLSLFCALTQCIVQSEGALSMITMPFLLLLNALPLFIIMCVVYSLSNRVWIGYLTAAIPFYILLTVNYFKVYFRSETLSVHDFSLFSEATNIMTGYDFPIPYSVIIAVALAIAAFIVVIKFIKHKNTPFFKRMILFIISAAIGIVSYFGLYGSSPVYKKLPSFANQYNDVSVSNHKGFLFTFLSHMSSYEYKKPDGYSTQAVLNITGGEPNKVSLLNPPINVIAIMSEAFFDMEACENIEFYENMSPTPNLDRLKSNSKWGYILVPGYAGSTASTEFEFLTGINISHIDSAMPVVYKTHVTRDTYSLAHMFSDMGYLTEAFHPGNAWFYNRKAAYPRLGFDNANFIEDFEYTNDDLVNYYVSDKITSERIISEYEDYLSSGNDSGYFSFTVTIQNHGPYSKHEPEIKRIKNSQSIDSDGYNSLCNYANGLHDADALLGEVCDYVETVDKPTVVVFFGDHLPYFDADGKSLGYLGYDVTSDTPRAFENRYSTPYIIHGNAAFNSLYDNSADNSRGDTISSSYLSTELLNYMNIDYSPYFEAIDNIKNTVSHISGATYIINGQHVKEPDESSNELLKNYEYLSYWAMREYKNR